MNTLYIVLLIIGVWAVVWGICHYLNNGTKETSVLHKGAEKHLNVNKSSSNSNNDFSVCSNSNRNI